ncbi:MAG: cysteine methyltransferase [Chromatiales bacterium 21-64-14]|nr:MAG: cysteine methyltransferase [Chromatiales bacterium 21-64-14]HQU16889.1 methylated-DNA--[protein]-cysteine S-methyltransferase [Gammaproteobacteria bacterium]
MTHSTIYYDDMPSPVGSLRLVADAFGLRGIWFEQERHPKVLPAHAVHSADGVAFARVQLHQYFAGERRQFDFPLHPLGTPFQLAVWQELARIPYGVTIHYGELARRIGQPRAARAVGAVNGRNPLPIVLPCHRVMGSNGSLSGFAGGLPIKRFLLDLEHALPVENLFRP